MNEIKKQSLLKRTDEGKQGEKEKRILVIRR
jgi:hypothetical protein